MSLSLLPGLLLPLQQVLAQEPTSLGDYWGVYGTLDYLSWDALDNLQPLGRGGPFDTSGAGAELGGYASVARFAAVRVLAGVKLGVTGFNHNAIFASDPKIESAMELNYLSAAMRLRFGKAGGRYVDLELGVGSYVADSKYIDCSAILSCFAADTSSNATGINLNVTGMLGRGVILGARMHRVDFAPIEAIDLGASPIDGPIYSLFIGWEFSNWARN